MENNELKYPDFLYDIMVRNNKITGIKDDENDTIDNTKSIFVYSNLPPKLFLKSLNGSNYLLLHNPITYKHKFLSIKEIIEINETDPFSPQGNHRQYVYMLPHNIYRSQAYEHIE